MKFTILVDVFMEIITKHLVFCSACVGVEKRIFEKKLTFIAHMAPTHDALEMLGHPFYFLYSSYPRDPAINQKL